MAHLFDYFSDVGSGFLEVVEFFPEHADFGVEGVAVCFEALEVCCAFLYSSGEVAEFVDVVLRHGRFAVSLSVNH